VDSKERATRLAVAAKLRRFHIKRPRRSRFVYGNVDCADPRIVHANVRDEVSSDIDDCDVQRASQGLCFLFRTPDDTARLFKV
jgi:hypothetical protein